MNYRTFRAKDMEQERILSAYLDRELYVLPMFHDPLRTVDVESQIAGSDLVVSIPSLQLKDIMIDEKAQLHYPKGGLRTFAFELNFINRANERVEGWLTDSSKRTEFYNLLFLTVREELTEIGQIQKVEYILVERQAILDHLKDKGLDIQALRDIGNEVATCQDFRQHKRTGCHYYFTHSTRLAESPVNIILKKIELINVATLHGFV